jgi:phosphatidylinositol dimannoside acyltransferase
VTARTAGTGMRATEALPPRASIAQRVRARLIGVFAWLAAALPEGLAIRLADVGGRLWYRATPERAALARRQLLRVCRHLADRGEGSTRVRAAATTDRALETMVRAAYRHAARYYLEVMRTPRINMRYIRNRVLIETPDVVDEAFAGPSPVIFVGAHFGAIELPALYFAQRTGRRVVGPMETVDDPALQAWFVGSRARVGIRIVGLREARRELLASLRRGESVGLVGDRDITGGGIEVSLFGHPARLPVGPALLAVESGAPIYVAAVRRSGPGRYRARLEPIDVAAEGSRRARTTATVARLAAAFESAVAEAPDQWWAVFFPIWEDLADEPATTEPATTEPATTEPATTEPAAASERSPGAATEAKEPGPDPAAAAAISTPGDDRA